MWFLGAGTSVAAGVPTAWDLIWQFKRKIYCSELRVSPALVDDLTNPSVRARIQRHFDGTGRFPAEGADDEYPAFFEATYPSIKDRRAFLDPHFSAKAPSFGHYVLAHLLKAGKVHAVWTTNFDRLVEEAVSKVVGNITSLRVATPGSAEIADQAFHEGRWPLLVKLHGDFHSERLKNTQEELRKQDEQLRNRLLEACKQYGLAVVGYSGRDNSVMDALESAVDAGGLPNGLFWFARDGHRADRITSLIDRAKARRIQAEIIELTNFDELFNDISRFIQGIDKVALSRIAPEVVRLVKATVPEPSADAPFIRTNALPVMGSPATCRLVECGIGGYEEVQKAIELAKVDIVASRCGAGVIAFGRDAEVRKAFEPHGIKRFDYHPINPDRLTKPSGELSLMYQALARSLRKIPGLVVTRLRASSLVLALDTKTVSATIFTYKGVNPVNAVTGVVKQTQIRWREAASIQIDHQAGRAWLLLRPRVVLENVDENDLDALALAKEFIRERQAVRRNQEHAALLEGWIGVLFGDEKKLTLRAFEISDGADAVFEILRVTAFSGKGS